MVRKDESMRLFSYLSVAVLLVSSVVLTAYSPDLLSMVIVGFMCMITLAWVHLWPFADDLVYGRTAERTEQHSQGIRDRRQLGMGRGAAD